ncbi:hypothetical protein [Streptomyces tritici]|uniref:hypothetical protein n=1 Tax=Streptomyces tritici TaxID=2054410 RepID=UPI003AF12C81
MTRTRGSRLVVSAVLAVALAFPAACGAGETGRDGRRGPASGGRPERGADEAWFTTAGVTPQDPAVLLRELRAGRTPRALGLVRSGAAADVSYVYVNWAWTLWPPGLRPVGVALAPVRVTGSTVAVGPVRRHGRVPELSLRVRDAGGAARTATLREWQRAAHTFPGGGPGRGFTYQFVVAGEPAMDALEAPGGGPRRP